MGQCTEEWKNTVYKMKKFRLRLIARILLLASALALFVVLLFVQQHYLRSVYAGILVVVMVVEMIFFVDKTNRDISAFLLAILQNDFSTTFNENNKGSSFNDLYSSMNKLTSKFRDISSAKKVQHLFLETLVEHIKVGVISFDQNGQINLMNQAFKSLINKPGLPHLDSFSKFAPTLHTDLKELFPGDKKLSQLNIGNNVLNLSLHATAFKVDDTTFTLVSAQNIKQELDSKELESYQKLIRVLTHEIMNSVTPITSLSGTLHGLVKNSPNLFQDPSTGKQLLIGLEAIKNRSDGLQNFTTAYQELSKLPLPVFTSIDLIPMVDQIVLLTKQLPQADRITFNVEGPKSLIIPIDGHMVEQVLLNFMKNASEALTGMDGGKINVIISKESTGTCIKIMDNGPGIPPTYLDKIFVPFFTTKKQGNGIGLALAKQIIKYHNGEIKVSTSTKGTCFSIIF